MHTFWEITDTGKLNILITEIYEFLNSRGYCIEKQGSGKTLYKVTDHMIDLATTEDLTFEIIKYLKYEYVQTSTRYVEHPRKDDELFSFTPAMVLEAVTKFSFKRIFDEINWEFFNTLSVRIKKHTQSSAFYYFRNGYIEVTAKGATLKKYDTLPDDEKIFKSLIIDRDISVIDIENENQVDNAPKGSKFLDFLHRISCGVYDDDQEEANKNTDKLNYLMKLIGFTLHDFKRHGKTDIAPFICDENVGGTGKGTLLQAISQIIDPHQDDPKYKVSICEIDGRRKQEVYDPVDLHPQTRLKVYNDISHAFDLTVPFNEITDSSSIRQMHGGTVKVPYAKSWKVLVLANFTLQSGDGPGLRRWRIYYMNPFFNQDNTIRNFYNQSFFSDEWDNNDWTFFYNVMFWCVKNWLKADFNVRYDDPEYLEYKIESTYYPELIEFVNDLPKESYRTKGLYEDFKNNIRWKDQLHIKKITPTTFGRFLTNYLKETGRKFVKSSNRTEIWIDDMPGKEKKSPPPF